MNTPVSFELAKLLKKKGFGLKVFHFYQGDNLNQNGDCFLFNHSIRGDHYISAPTIAEVVMWLYEKHRIWIEVKKHTRNGLRCFSPYIDNKPVNEDVFFNDYDTPTESYEAGIKHALKNLL